MLLDEYSIRVIGQRDRDGEIVAHFHGVFLESFADSGQEVLFVREYTGAMSDDGELETIVRARFALDERAPRFRSGRIEIAARNLSTDRLVLLQVNSHRATDSDADTAS